MKLVRVGIIAPSSKVPEVEFELGLEVLREHGIEPVVHPQVLESHLFFAGTDESRAEALWNFAFQSNLPVLWAARGGYGSARLLPLLAKWTKKKGKPPRKLLIGFSDSTALLEWVRVNWGWRTLHAPMPGLRKFCLLSESEWRPLLAAIRGKKFSAPWEKQSYEWLGQAARADLESSVVGGNLSVWASLVGTPYAGNARGKILFLEDVDENLYRVDRMVQQLIASGAFKGVKAVILGNFVGCSDTVPRVLTCEAVQRVRERAGANAGAQKIALAELISSPDACDLAALRETGEANEVLAHIFEAVDRECGVPVLRELPVGHGPGRQPLPLGARLRITRRGRVRVASWK